MRRYAGLLVGLLGLAGCAPTLPDSNRGVGFGSPDDFLQQQAQRDRQLAGSGSTQFAGQELGRGAAITSAELSAAGIGGGAAQTQPGTQQVGAPLSAINPAPTAAPATDNIGISDEQDFSAVTARESIQSDAERRAAQAAQRQEIQPTALPDRPANTGPNIVQYALSAPNQRGQEWYSRSLLTTQGRFQRNCAEYNSPDAAQRDFLARGGPERDPRGIDPDGDGFACGWDPAPFRLAAQGG